MLNNFTVHLLKQVFSQFCCHSGTLSYIFNNFIGTRAFSDVVAEAKQAGYTEPDPRDDLSGTDVARKVLSLITLSNC
jgi:homoserine dehydrogenase